MGREKNSSAQFAEKCWVSSASVNARVQSREGIICSRRKNSAESALSCSASKILVEFSTGSIAS